MGKTFAEKVLARKSGQAEVVPGQIVIVEPDQSFIVKLQYRDGHEYFLD